MDMPVDESTLEFNCPQPESQYLKKYWPGLTKQAGIENYSNYKRVVNPTPNIIKMKSNSPSLYVVMHAIDQEIIYGGISAFFKFIALLAKEKFNSTIHFILLDQPNGVEGAKYQVGRETHPLSEKKSQLKLEFQIFNDLTSSDLYILSQVTLLAYNARASYLCSKISTRLDLNHFYYFVQEDESVFLPHNSMNAAIKESYNLNSKKIVNSSILFKYMSKNYPHAFEAEPTIVFEHQYLKPTANIQFREKKNQVIIYFRPENHAARNCAEIILESLRIWNEKFSHLYSSLPEFYGLGAFKEATINIGEVVLNVIPKLTLDEYTKYMTNSSVGISLMNAPHPSVVPYEMAEFGVRCVTNTFQNRSPSDLLESSKYIYPSSLDPLSVACQLQKALSDFSLDYSNDETLYVDLFSQPIKQRWDNEFHSVVKSMKL